jgi:hypothetical protein
MDSLAQQNKAGGSMSWGLVFIVVGLIFVAEWIFGIDIPVFRTLFAFFLIYFGLKLLLGNFGIHLSKKMQTENEAVFSSSTFRFSNVNGQSVSGQSNSAEPWDAQSGGQNNGPSDNQSNSQNKSQSNGQGNSVRKYTTVFGESTLDLRELQVSDLPKSLKFDTVFGNHTLKIRKGLPIEVKTSTVFGRTELPEKNVAAFGQFTYRTAGLASGAAVLQIEANVVFGGFRIVEE